MAEFRMPSLGADMDAGTLLEWLVKPGDTVTRGDIVAVVDTSKAAVEVECFESGVVDKLLVEPGVRVPVGTPLAMITTAPAESAAPPPPPAPAPSPAPVPSVTREVLPAPAEPPAPTPVSGPAPASVPPASPLVRHLAHEAGLDLDRLRGTGPGGQVTHEDVDRAISVRRRPYASPLARRLATELGVDLTTVTGTGRDGAVRADDVREAAAASRPTPAPEVKAAAPEVRAAVPEVTARQAAAREATARLMARSKREIPHYYLSTTIDLTTATDWLAAHNRRVAVSERLLPAALLLKAAALAAAEVPELNGYWIDDRFVPGERVRLGLAVSLRGGGLVVPGIADAANLPLPELMAQVRDLGTRARAGRLRASELADPTITISNLGEAGVDAMFGVIYPPQVALVGFGAVVRRPWAVDDLIGVRPVVTASLSADHRATDGATGARYLHVITRLLGHPEEL